MGMSLCTCLRGGLARNSKLFKACLSAGDVGSGSQSLDKVGHFRSIEIQEVLVIFRGPFDAVKLDHAVKPLHGVRRQKPGLSPGRVDIRYEEVVLRVSNPARPRYWARRIGIRML